MKSISCGALVLDPAGSLRLGHANESRYWEIPKDGGATQEQGAQTAVREAFEECGLRLVPGQLREIGLFDFRRDKALRLFAVLVTHFEATACVCSSFFTDRHGRRSPEMNGFRWATPEQLPQLRAPSLVAVLTQAVSLATIHGQLLYEVGPVHVTPTPSNTSGLDPAQGRTESLAQEYAQAIPTFKGDGFTTPHRDNAMNITLNGILQFLGFSIATLLAMGALVLGGLNERNYAPDGQVLVSHSARDAR